MFVPSAPRGLPVVRRAKHATRLRNRRSRRDHARCGHGRLVRRFGASPTVVSLADRVSNDSFPHPSERVVRTNAEGLLSRAAHLAHPTFTARV
jgi:hypothetical protein